MKKMDSCIEAIRRLLEKEYTGKNLQILLEHLNQLEEDELFLSALRAVGVKEWKNYEKAQELYEEWRKESDELFCNR